MNTKNKFLNYIDTLWLFIGELIVSLPVIAIYLILGKFDYTVITGSLLGATVITVNFLILSIGITRAVNNYIEARGNEEMDEEKAAEFATAHSMDVQNAMLKSYFFRMALMIGSIVIAGITKWFNVIALVVPLLMYRPTMYAIEAIKTKLIKRGE